MFTGIVEELGEIVDLEPGDGLRRLAGARPAVVTDAHARRLDRRQRRLPHRRRAGDGEFTADVMAETLNRTSLGALRPGSRGQPGARRWRSAAGSAATSCRATSTAPAPSSSARRASTGSSSRISLPAAARPLRRREGLDHRRRRQPHRRRPRRRLLHRQPHPDHPRPDHARHKGAGDPVNLEVDVIAKYVERLLAPTTSPRPHHRRRRPRRTRRARMNILTGSSTPS